MYASSLNNIVLILQQTIISLLTSSVNKHGFHDNWAALWRHIHCVPQTRRTQAKSQLQLSINASDMHAHIHTYKASFQDNLGKVVAKCQTTLVFFVQQEIKGGGGDNQNCKM